MKKKFCRDVLSLAFTALLFLQAPAQLKALKVGEAIPEEVWTTPLQLVNSPQKTADLSADRDKLILLDFWATWCSACLKGFPKMEKLQEQYGERLKIVAVSGQDRATLEKFYASKNGQRYKGMSSVSGDLLFKKLFPHVGVPFIVWIKDGKLVNTTDAEQVTAENIRKVLGGDAAALQTVVQIDRTRPLMLDESFDRQRNVSMLNYSIFLKGSVPDIGSGGTLRYSANKKVNGRQFTNLPLKDIYYALGYELFKAMKNNGIFSEKHMLAEVKDVRSINGTLLPDGTFEGNDLYSYDITVPENRADSLYFYMLQDLNRYTSFTAAVERRKTNCLVLKRTGTENKMATKGGEVISTFPQTPSVLQNAPLWHMVNMINSTPAIKMLLTDETGYTGNVDIQVSGITTPEQLNKELARYGLAVTEEPRELNMLVITDTNGADSNRVKEKK